MSNQTDDCEYVCSHPDCGTTLGLTETDLGLLCGLHLGHARDICRGEQRLIESESELQSLRAQVERQSETILHHRKVLEASEAGAQQKIAELEQAARANSDAWQQQVTYLKQELQRYRASHAELVAALWLEHDALDEMCEWHGATHDPICPEDDTCDCLHKPFNDRVNSAFRAGESALETARKLGAAHEKKEGK